MQCVLYLSVQEESFTKAEVELRDLKESLEDTQPIGAIVKCTKTIDQVSSPEMLLYCIEENTFILL